MSVFISWSGDRSKFIAEALHEWLPKVIPTITVWISAEDIDKGANWPAELRRQLDKIYAGIICLTPENREAPWLLFESGAISKAGAELEIETRVATYLYDLRPADVSGPLSSYQHTIAIDKDDNRKLVLDINRTLGESGQLPEDRIQYIFEKAWPDLEDKMKAIPNPMETDNKQARTSEDMLEELLIRVRGLSVSRVFNSNSDEYSTTLETKLLSLLRDISRLPDLSLRDRHRYQVEYENMKMSLRYAILASHSEAIGADTADP